MLLHNVVRFVQGGVFNQCCISMSPAYAFKDYSRHRDAGTFTELFSLLKYYHRISGLVAAFQYLHFDDVPVCTT